jgi:peptide/nickel transport system substrate-binding protein
LKEIYIDAELDVVDTTQWHPRVMRRDFTVALQVTEAGVDDPNQAFTRATYAARNATTAGYCNPVVDTVVDLQSIEPDPETRKKSSGRSSGNWRKTRYVPSFIIHAAAAACSPGSKS